MLVIRTSRTIPAQMLRLTVKSTHRSGTAASNREDDWYYYSTYAN
jgi:hypothetical protein